MAPNGQVLLLLAAITLCWLALAVNVGGHWGDVRGLGASSSSNDGDAGVTSVEKQQEKDDMTVQPSTTDSSDSSFPSTSTVITVVAVGLVLLTALVFLLVVLRRGRNESDSGLPSSSHPPENSRLCMKRTTFAVPEASRRGLHEIDYSGSVVPVLGNACWDDSSHRKMQESAPPEMKTSWAEASAATSSYSVAPLAPTMIYMPARGRGLNDSNVASEYSSHTDDYSIGMLESPVSTVYSFGSEGDDQFPSTRWEDDVDSYRSMDCTFLSTSSSDVFGSNRSRSSGAWKQVYGPTEPPPVGSGLSPLSSGVLFVRNIDPTNMRRMRLDTRARGNNRMRFGVEV